jgi:hypothetical protein
MLPRWGRAWLCFDRYNRAGLWTFYAFLGGAVGFRHAGLPPLLGAAMLGLATSIGLAWVAVARKADCRK